MIEVKSLEKVDFQQWAAVFNRAFSDYVIPVNIDRAGLVNMLGCRSWKDDLSGGIYVDGELAAFSANACRVIDGEKILYIIAFGIVPEHRRQGYGSLLLNHLKSAMRRMNAKTVRLEVMTDNVAACSLYRKNGFITVRKYLCFSCSRNSLLTATAGCAGLYEISGVRIGKHSEDNLKALRDFRPSWQNEFESARRGGSGIRLLSAVHDGAVAGYVLFNIRSGAIMQLATDKQNRGQGVAGALLYEVAKSCESESLSLVNIDEKAGQALIGYLRYRGFADTVSQYEMEYHKA